MNKGKLKRQPKNKYAQKKLGRRRTKTYTEEDSLHGQLPLIIEYVPPSEIDTKEERILDREGWPIHPEARVRVERESTLLPGRIESFIGDVFKIVREESGVHRGRVLILVKTEQGFYRHVVPENCKVRRKAAK